MDIKGRTNRPERPASGKAADEARTLFAYLLLACKNLSLYPEGHVIGVNSIRHFHARLTEYTRQYGAFRIEVERTRVVCGAAEVFAGPSEEGSLPFTLFRDGIRWLEFERGATLEEVQELLSIINRYSILAAEPEGDIVTALWEARFEHIRYEAADFFFGLSAEQTATVSTFDAGPKLDTSHTDRMDPDSGPPPIDPSVLILSSDELEELKTMIADEEAASASAHLRMLLDSLLFYEEEADLKIILTVLKNEFALFLVRGEYDSALIIVEGLHYLARSGRIIPRLKPLIDVFIFTISDFSTLKPVYEAWPYLSLGHLRTLSRLFHFLDPCALETLARMIVMQQPPQHEQILEEAIIALSGQNPSVLKSLLNKADDRIVARLIPVLTKLNTEEAIEFLLAMCRKPAVFVRRLALRALLKLSAPPAGKIFDFIGDEDADIRRLVLRQLGRVRDSAAETLLVTYLEEGAAGSGSHLLECYRTLGKCGSERSVAFLKKKLMRRRWYPGAAKSPECLGAAEALAGMDNPQARQVLDAAAKSLFPWMRRLVARTIRNRKQGETR
ncbi:MAG TPA: hypothetical protein PK090_07775 [Smithellaceae bacterium]|nr:hypothetical protein [Smithellaceae bacterium]